MAKSKKYVERNIIAFDFTDTSDSHTAHNQTRKAHRNGIKRKARGRVTKSMTGVDAKVGDDLAKESQD